MFCFLQTDHLCIECLFKDKIDLIFFTKCVVVDHSSEDFQIILEKIMAKRNINDLSRVHKNYFLNSKNLQITTRQGTKIGEDNIKSNSTTL